MMIICIIVSREPHARCCRANVCVSFEHILTIIDRLERGARAAIIWNKLPLPTRRDGAFINSQVISRLLYDPRWLRTVRTIRLPAAAIYICIGKQICPGRNGWSDRRVTKRVTETCAKFLHGSVINELPPRTNRPGRLPICSPAKWIYSNWMQPVKRRRPGNYLVKFDGTVFQLKDE